MASAQNESIDNPCVFLSETASLRGVVITVKDSSKPVYTFRGVPYAEPPIGERRFKWTSPLKLWTGERNAETFGNIAIQELNWLANYPYKMNPHGTMSEDCLYLNVYTPSCDQKSRLPVMVYIHGGGLKFGYGHEFEGTALSSHCDIVVVTFNYRLGCHGDLYTNDGSAPGNMGFYDQVETLKWVQKYISCFGGNPDNVTIFGQSAGGVSVDGHILSKVSTGLFHKAICMSGCITALQSLLSTDVYTSHLKSNLGETKTDEEIFQYISDLPEKDLLAAGGAVGHFIIDGETFDDTPERLLNAGRFNKVPIILGFAEQETLHFVLQMSGFQPKMNPDTAKTTINMALNILSKPGLSIAPETVGKIVDEVMKDQDESEIPRLTEEIMTDLFQIKPVYEQLEWHKTSNKNPVYQYVFQHRPKFSTAPDWAVCDHTWDLNFVFGEPFMKEPNAAYNQHDKHVSWMAMKMWSNFAKSGDPSDAIKWPRFQEGYLSIQHSICTGKHYRKNEIKRLNKLLGNKGECRNKIDL